MIKLWGRVLPDIIKTTIVENTCEIAENMNLTMLKRILLVRQMRHDVGSGAATRNPLAEAIMTSHLAPCFRWRKRNATSRTRYPRRRLFRAAGCQALHGRQDVCRHATKIDRPDIAAGYSAT